MKFLILSLAMRRAFLTCATIIIGVITCVITHYAYDLIYYLISNYLNYDYTHTHNYHTHVFMLYYYFSYHLP